MRAQNSSWNGSALAEDNYVAASTYNSPVGHAAEHHEAAVAVHRGIACERLAHIQRLARGHCWLLIWHGCSLLACWGALCAFGLVAVLPVSCPITR